MIGPAYPELPFFGTTTELWAHEIVRRHRYRFDASWEDQDIFQEILVCYLKMLDRYPARACAEKYPALVARKELWDAVTDIQMSLLKRIVTNRIHDLTNKNKRPAHLVKFVKDSSGELTEIVPMLADTVTDSQDAWLIASQYEGFSPELKALLESPLSEDARRSKTRADGTRETSEQRLRRIAGYRSASTSFSRPLRDQLAALTG